MMAEDKHEAGKMDIEEQEKTFAGFMRWVTNASIIILVVLVVLAVIGT